MYLLVDCRQIDETTTICRSRDAKKRHAKVNVSKFEKDFDTVDGIQAPNNVQFWAFENKLY